MLNFMKSEDEEPNSIFTTKRELDDEVFFFKRINKSIINPHANLPQIMTPNISVDKQSIFGKRRKKNRYDIANIRN